MTMWQRGTVISGPIRACCAPSKEKRYALPKDRS